MKCGVHLTQSGLQDRIAGSESSQLAEALAATEAEAEAARAAKEAAAAKRAEMAEMAKVRPLHRRRLLAALVPRIAICSCWQTPTCQSARLLCAWDSVGQANRACGTRMLTRTGSLNLQTLELETVDAPAHTDTHTYARARAHTHKVHPHTPGTCPDRRRPQTLEREIVELGRDRTSRVKAAKDKLKAAKAALEAARKAARTAGAGVTRRRGRAGPGSEGAAEVAAAATEVQLRCFARCWPRTRAVR